MPVEIEAKIKVPELSRVRARLVELGARRAGRVVELNAFFDTGDQALRRSDCGLRTRLSRDLESGREKITVTYKGPRRHGPLKSREEIEITCNDAEAMAVIFERLGYRRGLCFEKRRESWKLGGCSVELDELPHLGTFVEVEGPAEQSVTEALGQLGLAGQPLIKESYIALLARHLNEQGLGGKIVRLNP